MIIDRYRRGINQKRVLLANPDGFSNEMYRKLTGVDRDQAYREIQELVTLIAAALREGKKVKPQH